MFTDTITYPAAFIAGLLSFLSPCILPLIPAYFTFITGYSLEQLTDQSQAGLRHKVFLSTLSYVAGFSFVFILMGATASIMGKLLFKFQDWVRISGGILIILLGIHLTGLFRIPLLDMQKKITIVKKPLHVLGTFLVGMAFGAGWTPCIGPLLGSILVVAGNQETVGQGVVLLGIYSGGLALPFILLSLFIHLLVKFIRKANRIIKYVNPFAGILLILMGVLLLANKLTLLARAV
jgi:cytochrome c-type biogenesis protein